MERTPTGAPQGPDHGRYEPEGDTSQYPPRPDQGQYAPGPDQGQYPPQYPPYQQGPPQGYGQGNHHQGPGVGERAGEVVHSLERRIRTQETKPFFLTSEFMVWAFSVLGVLIAGAAVSDGGNGDPLRADTVWSIIAAVSFGYIISRGISKAGTKYDGGRDGGHGR